MSLLDPHRALLGLPVAEAFAVARVDVRGLVAVARAPREVVHVPQPLRLDLHPPRNTASIRRLSPKKKP